MHTTFVQSLLKSGTLKSSKSPLKRFYAKQQIIKPPKNHYDTLKITPHATQDEIKSAYYKLTLQYHPDKNTTEFAKQKFQDVSEAYEVLSNHDLRKSYDQRMRIHQPPISTTTVKSSTWSAQNVDKTSVRPTQKYNFDAWISAHYGQQMDIINALKKKRAQMKESKKEDTSNVSLIVQIIILAITITILCAIPRRSYDHLPKKE